MDGRWCGVPDSGVSGSFGPVACVSAFDGAGVGAFAAWWVQGAGRGQLCGDPLEGGGDLVRGESARYRWRYGARCGRL